MDTAIIIGILGAIGGGAGLAAVLTVVFQYRKFQEEARKLRIENEQKSVTFITDKMKTYITDLEVRIDKLTEANDALEQRVDTLNKKLQRLMNWIVVDDHRYRSWMESKLREYDPNLTFPDLPDPPDVFGDDYNPKSTKSEPKSNK